MKIKFEFDDKSEDFEIADSFTNLSVLKEKAMEMSKIPEDSLVLSFIDIVNEENELRDQHDVEYFIENAKENVESGKIIVKGLKKNSDLDKFMKTFRDNIRYDNFEPCFSPHPEELIVENTNIDHTREPNCNTQTFTTGNITDNNESKVSEAPEYLIEIPDRIYNNNEPTAENILKEQVENSCNFKEINTFKNLIIPKNKVDNPTNISCNSEFKAVLSSENQQQDLSNFKDIEKIPETLKKDDYLKLSNTSFEYMTITIESPKSNPTDIPATNIEVKSPKILIKHNEATNSNHNMAKIKEDNFQLADYMEVNDKAYFNETVFKCGKLDLIKDMSSIFPCDETQIINQIQDNYNFTKNNEKMLKNMNRNTQQFTLIKSEDQQAENLQPNEQQLKTQKFAFNLALEENPKIKAIEMKLDTLSEVFLDSLNSMREEIQNNSKILLSKPDSNKTDKFNSGVNTRHMYVTCDNCKKANFVGKRFKCLECWDYDICEACEALNVHAHVMVRISNLTATEDLMQLNSIYRLKKKIDKKPDSKVKEEFLKILTKNGYGDEFYNHMVQTYHDLTIEQFVATMVKIFA